MVAAVPPLAWRIIHNHRMEKEKEKEKNVDTLRCPNCGAPIKSRQVQCDYCGHYLVWYNDEVIDTYDEKPPEKEIESEPEPKKETD